MGKLDKDKFYFGFGAEHFIISQFYKMHYEATKMEVDFGYDILVTNQYRYSKKVDDSPRTMAIQVKSRTVNENDYDQIEEFGFGVMKYAVKEFYLSVEDFELLINKENSYLVCLFINENNNEPLGLFWFSGEQLRLASDREHITRMHSERYGDAYMIIGRVFVRTTINHLLNYCLDRIEENSPNVLEHTQNLRYLLDESSVVPLNNVTDIDLVVPYTIAPSKVSFSYGQLKEEITKLNQLGNYSSSEYIVEFGDLRETSPRTSHHIDSMQKRKFEYELEKGYYD